MGTYTRKIWSNSVIEAANRAETREETQIKIILDGILLIKESPYLKQFPPNPIELNLVTGEGAEEADRIYRIHDLMHRLMGLLRNNYETPKFIWDYWTHKGKPYLRLVSEKKQIFSDLVQNLQNPEWVVALRECTECGKFILSTAKWKNKFCKGGECKRKYYGRKNEKNGRKKRKEIEAIEHELEPKIFECPGSLDEHMDVKITSTECINPNGKNIRGKWENACPTCPHYKKEENE